MDKKIKAIHDIFNLGSNAVINKQNFQLDEVMVDGTSSILFIIAKFVSKNGENILCGIDNETHSLIDISNEQRELYNENIKMHTKRLLNSHTEKILNYKEKDCSLNNISDIEKIAIQKNSKHAISNLSINDDDYKINWFSLLWNKSGDSLLVSVSSTEMESGLSRQPLYNEIKLTTELPDYNLQYQGNVVRIEKINKEFLMYIHPYPIEVMQSTQCKNTIFENIRNPFSVMDFIVNHADSDVNGLVYPDSDAKSEHNYIVVGILENVEIDIPDSVIGNVRIGSSVDVSEKFTERLRELSEECVTVAWVNIKSDSLYNAFDMGKKLLIAATEFLSFMTKNDMYDDWYGTTHCDNTAWDIQSHYPQIRLGSNFYIENCILGEAITLSDENMKTTVAIKFNDSADYMFDFDWIETFFTKLETNNKKVLRLRYALKWIVQAWNTEDVYDRVIYCSMALEFIINGEKGQNIFDEYANKAGRNKFTKVERNNLINNIVEKINIEEIEGFSKDDVNDINESMKKIIQSKLTEVSFGTKLDLLIKRLDIPISVEEKELLNRTRKIRNELIHGLNMSSISTLQMKKLCGVTSRILMYKLLDELKEE